MRYVQPYGVVDPDASYINGNPAVGLRGSIPPAESVEYGQREITNFIKYAGITPDSDDLEQFTRAVRSHSLNYAVDIGSVNALNVVMTPPVTSAVAGFLLRVKVKFTNTGPANIRVNGLGPIIILRANGANLSANDLIAGEVVDIVYDGAFFQIANYQGYSSSVQNNFFYTFNIPFAQDSGTVNALVGNFSPALTQLSAGDVVAVKALNTITGACTLKCNALSPKSIKSPGVQNLIAGQIIAGQCAVLIYDGTQFQLAKPSTHTQTTAVSGVNVLKRQSFQDPNSHTFSAPTDFVEVYRTIYVPVAAGNKVRAQVMGTLHGDFRAPGIAHGNGYAFKIRCSYSTDNGGTWTGGDVPNIGGQFIAGGFMTNIPYFYAKGDVDHTGHALEVVHLDMMVNILGEMTVPTGPPQIIFRVEVWTDRVSTFSGGSTLLITEHSPST